jgi:hypothetical protein
MSLRMTLFVCRSSSNLVQLGCCHVPEQPTYRNTRMEKTLWGTTRTHVKSTPPEAYTIVQNLRSWHVQCLQEVTEGGNVKENRHRPVRTVTCVETLNQPKERLA